MSFPRFSFTPPGFVSLAFILIWQLPVLGQTLQIDRLKANYLVTFIDFARWNDQIKTDEVSIGVLGEKDLGIELKKIELRSVESRILNVVQLETTKNIRLDEIDILFVGGGSGREWEMIREKCQELNILLVGDHPRFLEEGGAIQFTFRKNRLRFYVNQKNASSLGIQLSSKLIELAIEQPQ